MAVSRMHFQAIADVINRADYLSRQQREQLAEDMAAAIHEFNVHFRRDLFFAAATKRKE